MGKQEYIQSSNAQQPITIPNVVLAKRFVTDAQKRALLGTLQVRLTRELHQQGMPTGITLVTEAGSEYPAVKAIQKKSSESSGDGEKASCRTGLVNGDRSLRVGDRIKLINFEEAGGEEAAARKLEGCYEVHLSVLREPDVKEDQGGGDGQQLGALLKRTRTLQCRQYCLCCFSFIVPVLCMLIVCAYQVSDVS